jgi:hypothetical protein
VQDCWLPFDNRPLSLELALLLFDLSASTQFWSNSRCSSPLMRVGMSQGYASLDVRQPA